jgi:hypothetical protein
MKQKARYRSFAYFYRNEDGLNCRKYLDVKLEGTDVASPQLIVLTLRPGSCGEYDSIALEKEIEVKPDVVQHRVQSLMRQRGLQWVRIMNLSDLQETTVNRFFKKLGNVENGDLPKHSIFHPSRKEELLQHAKGETPFLLAWGDDPRAGKLGNTVVARIKEQGFRIINEAGPHHHPADKSASENTIWVDQAGELIHHFQESQNSGAQEEQNPQPAMEMEKKQPNTAEQIRSAFKLFQRLEYGDPLITEARVEGRWSLFTQLLRQSDLRPYVGTPDYDYFYTDHIPNAKALYEILEKHDGHKIIIDAAASPSILTMKGGLELLESAICSSPETGDRWRVGHGHNVPGKVPFTFNGKIALLVNQSKEELRNNKRFDYLLRDCVVV